MVSIVSINQLRHVSQDIDTFGGREGWQRHSISCCLSWTWGLAMSLRHLIRCAPLEGQYVRAEKGLWGQTETDSDWNPALRSALSSSSCGLVPELSKPALPCLNNGHYSDHHAGQCKDWWDNISRNKTQMKLSRKHIRNDTCVLITSRENHQCFWARRGWNSLETRDMWISHTEILMLTYPIGKSDTCCFTVEQITVRKPHVLLVQA